MSGAGSGMSNGGHSHGMRTGDSFDISWRHFPPQLMFPAGYPQQPPMLSNPGASQCSYQSHYFTQGVGNAQVRGDQSVFMY